MTSASEVGQNNGVHPEKLTPLARRRIEQAYQVLAQHPELFNVPAAKETQSSLTMQSDLMELLSSPELSPTHKETLRFLGIQAVINALSTIQTETTDFQQIRRRVMTEAMILGQEQGEWEFREQIQGERSKAAWEKHEQDQLDQEEEVPSLSEDEIALADEDDIGVQIGKALLFIKTGEPRIQLEVFSPFARNEGPLFLTCRFRREAHRLRQNSDENGNGFVEDSSSQTVIIPNPEDFPREGTPYLLSHCLYFGDRPFELVLTVQQPKTEKSRELVIPSTRFQRV